MCVSGRHCSSDGSADWCKLSCQLCRKFSFISVKLISFTTRITKYVSGWECYIGSRIYLFCVLFINNKLFLLSTLVLKMCYCNNQTLSYKTNVLLEQGQFVFKYHKPQNGQVIMTSHIKEISYFWCLHHWGAHWFTFDWMYCIWVCFTCNYKEQGVFES